MRNSIATYKESLSRIANEVLDAAEEIDVPRSNGAAAAEDAPTPGRRSSRRSPRLTPPVGSPANGAGSGSTDEIAKYKADIRKLQTSEAEIKALSFNYASILKEKEEQLSKLREENSSLRKSLEAKSAVEHESRDDSQKTLSNNSNVRKPVRVAPVPVAVSAAVPARIASTTVSAAPVRAVVTAAIPARIASTLQNILINKWPSHRSLAQRARRAREREEAKQIKNDINREKRKMADTTPLPKCAKFTPNQLSTHSTMKDITIGESCSLVQNINKGLKKTVETAHSPVQTLSTTSPRANTHLPFFRVPHMTLSSRRKAQRARRAREKEEREKKDITIHGSPRTDAHLPFSCVSHMTLSSRAKAQRARREREKEAREKEAREKKGITIDDLSGARCGPSSPVVDAYVLPGAFVTDASLSGL